MFTEQYLWLFFGLVAFGAFTQGFSGVGFGMVILAGMAFSPWDLERTMLVLNLMLPLLHISIIHATLRKMKINWTLVGVLLLGAALGVSLGYWFILVFGKHPIFRIMLGVVLALLAVNEILRPRVRQELNMGFGLLAGLAGGFLSGGFLAGGPPMALFIYSRVKDPSLAKGTMQFAFMVCVLWRLANIVLFGEGISLPMVKLAAQGLPFMFICVLLGHRLSRRVPTRIFLRIVYSFIGVAGAVNIFRGFFVILR